MTWILVGITLVALAAAGALLTYVVRLARQERDRSDARVLALTDLLHAEEPARSSTSLADADAVHEDRDQALSRWGERAPLERAATVESEPQETSSGAGTVEADTRRGLFAESSAAESRSAERLLIPVIGAVIVALALTALYALNRSTAAPPVEASPVSLELVSMRHERDGDTLSVTGLVRVPLSGRTLTDVTAVVLTFDRQGGFLASGRSPLDFRQLAPGEESPFLVRLPGARTVGRYRVTFRNGQGIVPHVDRRDEPPDTVADGDLGPDVRAVVHQ